MNRILSLVVLGLFAVNLAGCGSGKPEIPAAKDTKKVDEEKKKAEMNKAYQMGKPKGGKDPSKS